MKNVEPSSSSQLLACPCCSQEMQCEDGLLPLHENGQAAVIEDQRMMCPGSYGPGQPSRSGPQIVSPYVPAQIDAAAATEALLGQQCWGCGQPKRRGNGFCKRCFKLLPFGTIGVFLYQGVGDGFEAAFAAGLEYLKKLRADAEAAKGNLFLDVA